MKAALSEAEAAGLIFRNSLCRDRVGRTGVELEWFVVPDAHPTRRATGEELASLARRFDTPLPSSGSVSWEPGGQLELSSAPHESLQSCVDAVAADLAVVRERARTVGMSLVGGGLDPRPPGFTVSLPRSLPWRSTWMPGTGPTAGADGPAGGWSPMRWGPP